MIKVIKDPYYLSRQMCEPVKESQVKGLVPYIKAMVSECLRTGTYSMAAPQAGLNLDFFVARSLDPKVLDFDVVFSPSFEPGDESKLVSVDEVGPDKVPYKASRWSKIKMEWLYHNGQTYETREGLFEGDAAYIAQMEIDHLSGTWYCG